MYVHCIVLCMYCIIYSQVFKTIKILLTKLEKFSEDPEAAAQQEKQEGEGGTAVYLHPSFPPFLPP